MAHLLAGYPIQVLLSILNKTNRTNFLRLYRSCKWLQNTIEENQRYLWNYVTDDKITITINRPIYYPDFQPWANPWAPPPQIELPCYYKFEVNARCDGYLSFEDLCSRLRQFHGKRLAELKICSKEYQHISELTMYLYSQGISCEKLTIYFPFEETRLPSETVRHLRPLKLVILPIKYDNRRLQWHYDFITNDVDHLSIVEVRQDGLKNTLAVRDILSKRSVYIHYIHNYVEDYHPPEFTELYSVLLSFYKRFMGFNVDVTDTYRAPVRNIYAQDPYVESRTSTDSKLKDFQFYCQDSRQKPEDPLVGRLEDAHNLLTYITGHGVRPQSVALPYYPPEQATVFVPNLYHPRGPPLRGELDPRGIPEDWECGEPWRQDEYGRPERNPKKSLLLKTYCPLAEGFYNDRLVISITEGKEEGEYILTLFGDNSKRQKVFFAIAVLTDWGSYQRFLTLIDSRNFVFPMNEIENEVKQILCH